MGLGELGIKLTYSHLLADRCFCEWYHIIDPNRGCLILNHSSLPTGIYLLARLLTALAHFLIKTTAGHSNMPPY